MTAAAAGWGETGVVLAVGVAAGLLCWWLAGWWLATRGSRGHHQGMGLVRLPWWWRLAIPGHWFMGCLLGPGMRPATRRHYEMQLRRADLAGEVQADDVRAAQWGLALGSGLFGLVVWVGLQGKGTGLLLPVLGLVGLGWHWPGRWLRQQAQRRRAAAVRALPFALDMMTLCLEGGLHFQGAVQQVVEKGPRGPLRDELRQWLGDMRAGSGRADALRALAQRLDDPAVRSWVQVVLQADGLGMSLGPILRAQAEQRRSERFLRAEKLALQAPVKMLFPLILCIFPCTFLVIGFPIVMHLLAVAA